ncbi:MAG: hypothetical protein IPP78_03860 [Holophagaceae bacterium]|nr:hypothetical protein [Holophagaceae bacterium]
MPQPSDALKQILRTWLHDRHQALLEQVMMTWEEGLGRLQPDDALAEELVGSIPAPPPATQPAITSDPELGAALDLLDNAPSQAEVLHKLLDGLRPFADRSALFILKQGIASLYAFRGFDGETVKAGTPVVPPPELEALISGQLPMIQLSGEAYLSLVRPLSGLTSADIRIHPIRLKRRAVALVMVDSGLRRTLENPQHIRALVRSAEAALAFLAGPKDEDKPGTGPLKATGPMPISAPMAVPARPAPPAPPPPPPPPMARPTPLPPIGPPAGPSSPTMQMPIPAEFRSQAQPAPPTPVAPVAPMAPIGLPAAIAPSSMPTQQVPEPIEAGPTLDPKIRATAERLARVLVGDIELYFPQKVAQGRQQGNLYSLLRDELERSRATFIDRFGEPVEKQHRIFIQTVQAQLCEGIPSKLGPAPWV